MSVSRSLQLRLESKIDSVDAGELIALGVGREVGLEGERLDRLGMAVREMMVNAVTHGNGYSRDKSVHLTVESDQDGIHVSVRDEGEGFDPNDVPDPTQPENLLKTSGRGLLLMDALTDDFSIRRAAAGGMLAELTVRASAGPSDSERSEKEG